MGKAIDHEISFSDKVSFAILIMTLTLVTLLTLLGVH